MPQEIEIPVVPDAPVARVDAPVVALTARGRVFLDGDGPLSLADVWRRSWGSPREPRPAVLRVDRRVPWEHGSRLLTILAECRRAPVYAAVRVEGRDGEFLGACPHHRPDHGWRDGRPLRMVAVDDGFVLCLDGAVLSSLDGLDGPLRLDPDPWLSFESVVRLASGDVLLLPAVRVPGPEVRKRPLPRGTRWIAAAAQRALEQIARDCGMSVTDLWVHVRAHGYDSAMGWLSPAPAGAAEHLFWMFHDGLGRVVEAGVDEADSYLRGARKACLFDYQERELSAFARRIGAADPFEQP